MSGTFWKDWRMVRWLAAKLLPQQRMQHAGDANVQVGACRDVAVTHINHHHHHSYVVLHAPQTPAPPPAPAPTPAPPPKTEQPAPDERNVAAFREFTEFLTTASPEQVGYFRMAAGGKLDSRAHWQKARPRRPSQQLQLHELLSSSACASIVRAFMRREFGTDDPMQLDDKQCYRARRYCETITASADAKAEIEQRKRA